MGNCEVGGGAGMCSGELGLGRKREGRKLEVIGGPVCGGCACVHVWCGLGGNHWMVGNQYRMKMMTMHRAGSLVLKMIWHVHDADEHGTGRQPKCKRSVGGG